MANAPTINPGVRIGHLTASTDLSAKQFYGVRGSGTEGTVALANATTDAFGVLLNEPASGQACEIALLAGGGVVPMVAAGVIAVHKRVKFDANGKIEAATADADRVVGITLQASAADGNIIDVMLLPGLAVGAAEA